MVKVIGDSLVHSKSSVLSYVLGLLDRLSVKGIHTLAYTDYHVSSGEDCLHSDDNLSLYSSHYGYLEVEIYNEDWLNG